MQVRVALEDHPYNVHVGAGIAAQTGEIAARALPYKGARALLVHDSGVPEPDASRVQASLAQRSFHVTRFQITPSEPAKSLATTADLLVALAHSRHERTDLVVALGGGIVGDISGFAAAIYRRGVPIVQCPSTLLAMVDASVGGKTGVNLDVGDLGLQKNMVGAFWQPAAVIADVDLLRSLPPRELRAGLAECIKHALLSQDVGDPDLLTWTRSNIPRILALNPAALQELVARNVRAKAHIVAQDEREEAPEGGRALLNLGHTFGHALETLPGLSFNSTPGPLLHGEAVALGLIAAAATAAATHHAPASLPSEVTALLSQAGLPTKVRGLPDDAHLLERMAHDKKTRSGSLRLVLPTGCGTAKVVPAPPAAAIAAGLAAIRA